MGPVPVVQQLRTRTPAQSYATTDPPSKGSAPCVDWSTPRDKQWQGAEPITATTHIAIHERIKGKLAESIRSIFIL